MKGLQLTLLQITAADGSLWHHGPKIEAPEIAAALVKQSADHSTTRVIAIPLSAVLSAPETLRQRDELAEALNELLGYAEGSGWSCLPKARAVLAKLNR